MGENLFGLIFWMIIIFIWIFRLFKKKPLPQSKEKPQTEEEPEIKLEDLWETLGFPLPQPTKKPKPEVIVPKPKKIEILKEIPKEIPIEKPPTLEKKEEPVIKKEEELIFSQDKLQEGIILSIILGPPKAHQILPRWWNGLHVGLKNR